MQGKKEKFVNSQKLLIISGGYGDRNNDGMVTQEDTIFVSGMDSEITEEEICQHFGAIGLIKVHIHGL